eukprot:413751-Amphidinium_carterae.1
MSHMRHKWEAEQPSASSMQVVPSESNNKDAPDNGAMQSHMTGFSFATYSLVKAMMATSDV